MVLSSFPLALRRALSYRKFPLFLSRSVMFHALHQATLVGKSERTDAHHAVLQHSQVALRAAVGQELDVPLRPPQLVSWVAGEGDALDGGDAVQPQEAHLDRAFARVVKLKRQKMQNETIYKPTNWVFIKFFIVVIRIKVFTRGEK